MNIRLIRNATLFIYVNKKGILVDPMLGPKGSFGKFPWTDSTLKNPLVDLPLTERDLQILIKQTDAILLTHMHPDHWDSKAQGILPREIPIYCQPEDMPELNRQKFTNLTPVNDPVIFEGITIIRTKGKHGLGEIGDLMGKVSGYVIQYKEEKLYLTGDTIWCDDVMESLDKYSPDLTVVNGGGARFNIGQHVTMDKFDIKKLLEYYPGHEIAIVHLESVSPSQESRKDLIQFLSDHEMVNQVIIPDDGDVFTF